MTAHEEPPPCLSIGLALGDRHATNQLWDPVITEVMRTVIALRAGKQSPVRLNVIYYVPGDRITLDFEGVRTGRFSKKDSHLLVQAAVPLAPADNRRAVVLALLRDAVTAAETFARRRGLAESLDEVRAIVERATAEIS